MASLSKNFQIANLKKLRLGLGGFISLSSQLFRICNPKEKERFLEVGHISLINQTSDVKNHQSTLISGAEKKKSQQLKGLFELQKTLKNLFQFRFQLDYKSSFR